MGLYATTTSIPNLLPQFLKGNSTGSDAAGAAAFSAHIDRAEALVNSRLTNRFALPFTTVPPLVRSMAEDIACFYALRAAIAQDGQVDNKQIERFASGFETLELVAGGKMGLAMTDGSAFSANSANRIKSSTLGYSPTFNLDEPKDWAIDEDRLSDIGDAR